MASLLAAAWPGAVDSVGDGVRGWVTLASLVEKETAERAVLEGEMKRTETRLESIKERLNALASSSEQEQKDYTITCGVGGA